MWRCVHGEGGGDGNVSFWGFGIMICIAWRFRLWVSIIDKGGMEMGIARDQRNGNNRVHQRKGAMGSGHSVTTILFRVVLPFDNTLIPLVYVTLCVECMSKYSTARQFLLLTSSIHYPPLCAPGIISSSRGSAQRHRECP